MTGIAFEGLGVEGGLGMVASTAQEAQVNELATGVRVNEGDKLSTWVMQVTSVLE